MRVVEVERDAARQRAQALEPLRVEHLRFEALSRCDVGVDDEHRAWTPLAVRQEGPAALDDDGLANPGAELALRRIVLRTRS